MSNRMDNFLLSNVPHIEKMQIEAAQTVSTRIDEAIERMHVVTSDSYDFVYAFSVHWESDDTGGAEDSSLFIQTVSKLQNIRTYQRSLPDGSRFSDIGPEVTKTARTAEGQRRLFIFHYAGHAIPGSTPDSLIAVPKVDSDDKISQVNITYIKDELKAIASAMVGLDVLLVIDSCCAVIAGRGGQAKGARVELMAATARKGISNTRADGFTFTQHWCEAFTKLLKIGEPFTCNDIYAEIAPDPKLEQFPSVFILREGWDLPITFRLHPVPIGSTFQAVMTSRTVVTAFHVKENPNTPSMNQLIDYLIKAPVPMTVLSVLQTSNTLLLVRIPLFLQELLTLPHVVIMVMNES